MNLKLDIAKTGFIKIDQNIFELQQDKINSQFEKDYNNQDFRNTGYENIAVLSLDNLRSPIYQSILKKIFKILELNNLKYKFENVWLQHSENFNVNPNLNELPFIPHIDKIRKFKVMIYLNDVLRSNGPINFAKYPPAKLEKFRISLKVDYKIKKENRINFIPIKDYISCEGNFGTSIFFDTNAPHFAGNIYEKNSFRRILRFNFIKEDNIIVKVRKLFNKIIL